MRVKLESFWKNQISMPTCSCIFRHLQVFNMVMVHGHCWLMLFYMFIWLWLKCIHSIDVDLPLPDVQLSLGHSADPSPSPEAPGPSTSSASRHHRAHRSGGARDDRYRSGKQHYTKTPKQQNKTTCLLHSYSYCLCRHPHRGCAGSTGQTQRREDGTAHAD